MEISTGEQFYKRPEVAKRILEYCGVPAELTADFGVEEGVSLLQDSARLRELTKSMTVEFLSGWGERFLKDYGKKHSSRFPEQLGELFDKGVNIFRSIWDKEKVTFCLDIEYVSKTNPAEVYLDAAEVYRQLEPTYQCVKDIYREYGIDPMIVSTGQGYHYIFDVDSYTDPSHRNVTEVGNLLADLGDLEESLQDKYDNVPNKTKGRRPVKHDLGRAFDTVGRLIEFIAHKAFKRIKEYDSQLPLTIDNVTADNDKLASVDFDLSQFYCPLHTRVTRMAFSIHDKHKDPEKDVGARHIPIQIALPRYLPGQGERSLNDILRMRRSLDEAAEYAREITTNIPECTEGAINLIEDYQKSELYGFHREFMQTEEKDGFDLESVPPCISDPLIHPNPDAMYATNIQTLTRYLMKRGLPPTAVTAILRSKYEDKRFGWDYNWQRYDAHRHARVNARIYGGLIAMGLDEREDFNCEAHKRRNLCPQEDCGVEL